MRPAPFVAALLLAGLLAACTGGRGSDDDPASRPVTPGADGGDSPAPPPDGRAVPPGDGDRTPADTTPRSQPTSAGCDAIVQAPASIQDAIDAVTDRTTPYVLCLDGTFSGGGAPSSDARPGIGPYWGGIVITGRTDFTLRGLSGSKILGVPNDRRYPAESDPVEAQGRVDKGNLIKVVDSERITLEWLDVDGRPAGGTKGHEGRTGKDGNPTLNRLVWFQQVTDSTLRYSRIQHAGGECVRLKSNSQRNEVHNNEIGDCGYYQFEVQSEARLRKNGEAIYVGTDPAQITETQVNKQRYWGLDAALGTDRSSGNSIHHNVIRPGPAGADWGNECVDLKEDWGAVRADLPGDRERGEPGGNVVADNDCAGQFDPESGAFDSRGPFNTFEHNLVSGEVEGAAIRIGASTKRAGEHGEVRWRASGNRVRLNRLESFGYDKAVKAWADQPLAEACGNVDEDGHTDFDGDFAGDRDAAFNRARCSGDDDPPGPRGPVGVPDT